MQYLLLLIFFYSNFLMAQDQVNVQNVNQTNLTKNILYHLLHEILQL